MRALGDQNTHYWLLQGMLKATQTDAAGAFADGQLSPQQWAKMCEACRGCSQPGACARWLMKDHFPDDNIAAPEYCRNRDVLEALPQRAQEIV